jgi:predicted nucleic acid-binding protein
MALEVSWLLDTSIIIDALRGTAAAVVFAGNLAERPCISVVSISELRDGQKGAVEIARIDTFLATTTIYDVTRNIAEISGGLMRRFRKSHGLTTADALIAATAIHHRLNLATLNLKHFPMFPDLARPY